jgi:hypothetical protein
MGQQPQKTEAKPDPRDARVKELEEACRSLEAIAADAERRAEKAESRDLKTERDYLWRELAQIEAWADTAPPEALTRVRVMLKAALDGFKPALKPREMPEDAA